jgi:hypothetical protein
VRHKWTVIGVSLLVAATAYFGSANGRERSSGPLSGSWECVAHSSAMNDMPFTLDLKQNSEDVTGKLIKSTGEYPLTSSSYRKGVLEIHADAPDGKYQASGRLAHGQISGHWSKVQEMEGGFECQKQVQVKK